MGTGSNNVGLGLEGRKSCLTTSEIFAQNPNLVSEFGVRISELPSNSESKSITLMWATADQGDKSKQLWYFGKTQFEENIISIPAQFLDMSILNRQKNLKKCKTNDLVNKYESYGSTNPNLARVGERLKRYNEQEHGNSFVNTAAPTSNRYFVSIIIRMNHYCCVPRCSSWIKRDPQLIFHIFPEQGKPQVSLVNKFGQKERIDRRKAWILKLSIGKPVTDSGSVFYSGPNCFRPSSLLDKPNKCGNKLLVLHGIAPLNQNQLISDVNRAVVFEVVGEIYCKFEGGGPRSVADSMTSLRDRKARGCTQLEEIRSAEEIHCDAFVIERLGCVKPTFAATYEKGQTEVRRQIRSNRIRIEGSGKIRPAHSPPVFLNGTDN
ncbi:hypothetical protein NQ318_006434 [Aromia moschata]|uniref:Uncharacterized protein n=1 Tax=Aromia moschata TaxID=1265417 RepID=A0AAV8XJS2_9CUCU|nr:hypothetical protein NQ318_006434 [Aromia moschata]